MTDTQQDLRERLAFACRTANQAGALAGTFFSHRESLVVQSKGIQDMATKADIETENLIRAAITESYPDDDFLGEESFEQFEPRPGHGVWVVDPIDGTQPFICGIPSWCISLAYVAAGEIQVGVVYDPNSDELYAAARGLGATVNGREIRVSAASSLAEGLVGIGFSNRVSVAATLEPLERIMSGQGMFHRCGSGALSLSYVAAGRLVAYYEPHMNSWDYVAGVLLVLEAGGQVNPGLSGDTALIQGSPVLAAGTNLYSRLQQTVYG